MQHTLSAGISIEGYTTKELIDCTKYCAGFYGFAEHGVVPVYAKDDGVTIVDSEGREYIDMAAGYSSVGGGHNDKECLRAFVDAGISVTPNIYRSAHALLLHKELCGLFGYDLALIMNSGAEGNETALKAVWKWRRTTEKKPPVQPETMQIIVAEGCFHGRTTTLTGMLSDERAWQYFRQYAPEEVFVRVPFGNSKRLELEVTGRQDRLAAVWLEPCLGEGGVVIPPPKYLYDAWMLCNKFGIPLVIDEVQTGFGRTGKLLASLWSGVKPDIVIVGKPLGAGLTPVSAVLGKREYLDVFDVGTHGSTYGANPHSAAVARMVLRQLVGDNWCGNALDVGGYFLKKLRKVGKCSPLITDVRGKGLLIGVTVNARRIRPDDMLKRLLEEGIFTVSAKQNTIRFTPPLIITKEHIDDAMPRIARAFGVNDYT